MPSLHCYICGDDATSVEHVPAKCFFPKGHRENLITVPSCPLHNNATSGDDEYAKGIIVSALGNNDLAYDHWKGSVRRTYRHSPGLFFRTFQNQKQDAFWHDRERIDGLMLKISYGLYFHTYKRVWNSKPTPYYHQFLFADGKTDIEVRLPDHNTLPSYRIYEGSNQKVFKYQFIEGRINGRLDCVLKMVFYEGFEVLIVPEPIEKS